MPLSAVTGWGGDLYSTYFNPDTGQIVLVSKVQWDTAEDAQEYYDMLGTHVNARFTSINTDAELLDMFNYLQLGYAQWQWDGRHDVLCARPVRGDIRQLFWQRWWRQ